MANVSVKNNKKVSISVGNANGMKVQIGGAIVERYVEHDKYDGDYVVTSDVKDQTLETKNKLMTDDVTILKIPTFEVSNEDGGMTFYIGGN